jgi:uncharacterized protein YdeI (YjbR/CyaY-like superfamily)
MGLNKCSRFIVFELLVSKVEQACIKFHSINDMIADEKELKEKLTGDLGYEIIAFATASEWRIWLENNHENSNGIWLQLYKKDTGVVSIDHAMALNEALCFGWINGQAKKFDEQSYLQKFTPRRRGSIWSKRNIDHIERLSKEGKVTPAGLKEVEAAKKDGRWARAYDSPGNMTLPADFQSELLKDSKAKAFYDSLNKTNKYAICWRLQTAIKPETKERRKKNNSGNAFEGRKVS